MKPQTSKHVTKVFPLSDPESHAMHVKAIPGVGKPFLLFATLPDGNPSGADFSDAPICNNDPAVNQADIDAMLAAPPWDDLVY